MSEVGSLVAKFSSTAQETRKVSAPPNTFPYTHWVVLNYQSQTLPCLCPLLNNTTLDFCIFTCASSELMIVGKVLMSFAQRKLQLLTTN